MRYEEPNPTLIMPFNQIRAIDLPHVGGKGANLGELTNAGLPIPSGFCVTTTAFQKFMSHSGLADEISATLTALSCDDVASVLQAGHMVRERLGAISMPPDVAAAIIAAWEGHGAADAYAVRSSATAEDLPTASFAGQHDSYLNVCGKAALLDSVRLCWISLFTDRAILYRARNGFAHGQAQLAVIVQRMVASDASGTLFTADPVSGHRQMVAIDACFGLGAALVAGLVTPDHYVIDKRSKAIIHTQIADKPTALRPDGAGGVVEEATADHVRHSPVLDTTQLRTLADLGMRIEAHYRQPQDIEWCYVANQPYIVQARPITALFPVPEPHPSDTGLHVYVSFGHAQVMTDPMPPMALSVWRILFPFGKTGSPSDYNPFFCTAAGRLYIDPSPLLGLRWAQHLLPRMFMMADQHIARAIQQAVTRDAFQHGAMQAHVRASPRRVAGWIRPLLLRAMDLLWCRQPEDARATLDAHLDTYIERVRTRLSAAAPGHERLTAVRQWLGDVFVEAAFPIAPYVAAGLLAHRLVGLLTRGRANPSDVTALLRGLSGNVTTEMDLQVGDLADVARQSPDLVQHLCVQDGPDALTAIDQIPGGDAFLVAWSRFLERYGMRGPSEIDLSRPRWRDTPDSLLRVLISRLPHGETGLHRVHFQRMTAEAEAASARLTAAARQGLLGGFRAAIVHRMIRVARNLLPLREHPKLLLIRCLDLVRQSILEAADILQEQGRIASRDDIWFLELPEVIDALTNVMPDIQARIDQRRSEFKHFRTLTPPRVITSDGEIVSAEQNHEHLPPGALPGAPVSGGVVAGRARVVIDPTTTTLHPGEILVAPFTDPGWTPLFLNAAGLVMEVGGLMTHGSVVAREYGIPAVVGVLNATRQIRTGQQIRVHGDLGYVEILASDQGSDGDNSKII
jgi:pyruvate,water dikinase